MGRERVRGDLRETEPVASLRGDRGLRRLDGRRCEGGRRRCPGCIPRLGCSPRPGACRVLLQGRRRDRSQGRADRPGHDRRNGKAVARGAHGSRPGRCDSPLLGRRGVPAGGRGVRAVGRQSVAVHATTPARRRRPDHTLELSGRDSRLEARSRVDLRQHGRDEGRLRSTTNRSPHRRMLRGGGPPGRGAEHRHRRRLEGRGGTRLQPGSAGDLVHGIGRGRPRRSKRGNRPQLSRAARARRPQPAAS